MQLTRTVLAAGCLLTIVPQLAIAQDQREESARGSTGVAVVELFTSQGCSSCPSADRLLAEIDRLAAKDDLPIYTLSMHVDYWNRLGWTDPYSSRLFTARQHAYAEAARSTSVYTPQMVVNGAAEFIGSDGKKAGRAIADALQRPAAAEVDFTVDRASPEDDLRVRYQVTGAQPGSELVVCVVVDPEPNSVVRGENAGRELAHRSVVRAMRVERLSKSGRGELTIAPPAGAEGVEVVAFVQQRATRHIDGAAKMAVSLRPESRRLPL